MTGSTALTQAPISCIRRISFPIPTLRTAQVVRSARRHPVRTCLSQQQTTASILRPCLRGWTSALVLRMGPKIGCRSTHLCSHAEFVAATVLAIT